MGASEETREKRHFCPYCDEEIVKAAYPFCQACGLVTFHCPGCGKPVTREDRVCPQCGAEISRFTQDK